jgi:hypothetical protein
MSLESNGQPYRVSLTGLAAKEVKDLYQLAKAAGLGDAYLNAFKYAVRRLEFDPWGFSELIREVKSARLKIHIRVVEPLVIEFGIHEENQSC